MENIRAGNVLVQIEANNSPLYFEFIISFIPGV
jgi:hypothetical protein